MQTIADPARPGTTNRRALFGAGAAVLAIAAAPALATTAAVTPAVAAYRRMIAAEAESERVDDEFTTLRTAILARQGLEWHLHHPREVWLRDPDYPRMKELLEESDRWCDIATDEGEALVAAPLLTTACLLAKLRHARALLPEGAEDLHDEVARDVLDQAIAFLQAEGVV